MEPGSKEIDRGLCIALSHRFRHRMDVPSSRGDGDAASTVARSLDGGAILAAAAKNAALVGDSVLSGDGAEFIDESVVRDHR